MNDSKNLFCCNGACNQGRSCPARARVCRASLGAQIDERTSVDTQVATGYSKGLKDAIWLAGVLLACASVVCMLGVAP